MNKFLNQKGFSLVEIMIGCGMLGVLALGVMSLTKNISQSQVRNSSKMEEIDIRNQITGLLIDKNACQNTLNGKNIGSSIDAIKDGNGNVIFQTGLVYGNNSVLIKNIKTSDVRSVSATKREIQLSVDIARAKTSAVESGSRTYSFSVQVMANSPNGVITNCFVNNDMLKLSSSKQSCAASKGTWNETIEKCELPSCPTGQFLQRIDPTQGAICTTPNCPNGQYLISLDSNGNPICKSINCPRPKEVMKGIDSSGNPVCEAMKFEEGFAYHWSTGAWGACTGGSGFWTYGSFGACSGMSTYWSYGNYGVCSKICGGGTQSRTNNQYYSANTGSQSRSATCNYITNSATQTRSVTCVRSDGALAPDGNCSGVKPSTTQECTPNDESVCGTKQATQTCPSSNQFVTSVNQTQSCNTRSCGYLCECPYGASYNLPDGCKPRSWQCWSSTSSFAEQSCSDFYYAKADGTWSNKWTCRACVDFICDYSAH